MGVVTDGDRVRVVLEGEAYGTSKRSSDFTLGFNRIRPSDNHVMSVEKIEPPVVTFKSGQTVRGKRDGVLRTLGYGGYMNHIAGCYYTYDDTLGSIKSANEFTSAGYELVELK